MEYQHETPGKTSVLSSQEHRTVLRFLDWLDASGYWIVSQQGEHTWEWRSIPPSAWLDAFEQSLHENATTVSGQAAGRR